MGFIEGDTSVILAGYSTHLGNNTFFMGEKNLILFNYISKGVIHKGYKTIQQLTVLVILYINYGPECFHCSVVNYLFNINDDNVMKMTSMENSIQGWKNWEMGTTLP